MNIFMPGFPIYQFVGELAKLSLVRLTVMQMGPGDCIERLGEGRHSSSLWFFFFLLGSNSKKSCSLLWRGAGSLFEARIKQGLCDQLDTVFLLPSKLVDIFVLVGTFSFYRVPLLTLLEEGEQDFHFSQRG